MSERVRFIDLIICDDIRQEVGNKVSLEGIYTDTIVLSNIPFLFPKLCFYAKFAGCSGQYNLDCLVTLPDGEKRIIAENGKLNVQQGKKVVLYMAATGLKIDKPGKASITITLSKNKQKKCFRRYFTILEAKK